MNIFDALHSLETTPTGNWAIKRQMKEAYSNLGSMTDISGSGREADFGMGLTLRSHGCAARDFRKIPTLPQGGSYWEFCAVVEGGCGLILGNNDWRPLKRSCMWLFPPDHVHGWYGEGTKSCRAVSFQFPVVPEQLRNAFAESEFIEFKLAAEERQFIQTLAVSLAPDCFDPHNLSELRFQRGLLDLTLLVLQHLPGAPLYSTKPGPKGRGPNYY